MLRLTTVGRRTGRERVAILGYHEDGPNLVTLAMNGWGDGEPAWWLNLLAHPEAVVDLKGGMSRRVRARAATGEERARIWACVGWHTVLRGARQETAPMPTHRQFADDIVRARDKLVWTPTLRDVWARRENVGRIGRTWGDDIGISNLICYSHGLMGYRTPNVDRLARE